MKVFSINPYTYNHLRDTLTESKLGKVVNVQLLRSSLKIDIKFIREMEQLTKHVSIYNSLGQIVITSNNVETNNNYLT